MALSASNPSSSWWGTRWNIFRSGNVEGSARAWALGELVCALFTLTTLAVAITTVVLSQLGVAPSGLGGWPLTVLLAGAVGYGTNFVAVQMLFKPREPVRSIPLRWIWKQGLIPAKQAEMAEIVGQEVAERLLTPEAIVEEVSRIIEQTLDDPVAIDRMQLALEPLMQRHLPELLERLLPEALDALRQSLDESLPPEALKKTLVDFMTDWFASAPNRARLATFILSFFSDRTPELVNILRRTLRRYRKSSGWRTFALSTGEAARLINWDDFAKAWQKQMTKPKSHEWAVGIVGQLQVELRSLADQLLDDAWIRDLRGRAGDLAVSSIREAASKSLVPRLSRLLESESFHHYVRTDLIPNSKPKLVAWIKEGHAAPFFEAFDVRGRVARAAAALDVAEVEDMANRVGAYHLGAIQVLGYVLGLMAGGLLAMI